MIEKALRLLLVVTLASSMYTSSFWTKKGINVEDGIFEEPYDHQISVSTVCNDVDLSGPPYSHSGVVMSGYLSVNKGNSALAFIFYGKEGASKAELKNIPTILWLNGGPGSSSQMGNFMELGPHFVRPTTMAPYEIVKNNYTWIKEYNVLFVDQPVGTGLSYADPKFEPSPYVKSMNDVSKDFYFALNELYFTANGCFNKLGFGGDHPLIIFGESYAGKYAPAIGEKIKWEAVHNQGKITGLKGVAIGDGFTHPYKILTQVGEYAFNLGLIDYQERQVVEHLMLNATYQEMRRDWDNMHKTFDMAIDYIVQANGGVNVYDITSYREYPTKMLESFFESPDTINRFKLNPEIEYSSQSGNVYEGLYTDFMMQYTQLVVELLELKVNVMVYNGQNDLIVETPGTFKWVEELHQPGAA